METQKFDFFFQKNLKFEFWLLTKSWNHLCFVHNRVDYVLYYKIILKLYVHSVATLFYYSGKIYFFIDLVC